MAFYRGWLPSVIGVVPYVGLNFGVYETLKAQLLSHYGMRDERELSVSAGCSINRLLFFARAAVFLWL